MSHYTVGVIIDKNKIDNEVESALKKMEEEEKTSPTEDDIEFARFLAIKWKVEEALGPFSEDLEVEPYVDLTVEEVQKKHEQVKNYTEEEMAENINKKELHESLKDVDLETFAQKYYGKELTDKGIMSTYNPNSKWDWYVIGGRWANTLPIKNKISNEAIHSGYSDDMDSCARIEDIVFSKELSDEEIKSYKKQYEKLKTEGEYYIPEYYIRRYPTFEVFLKSKSEFSTYALLTSDGVWHAPGEMGWFGVSSATPEQEKEFKSYYNQLIAKENPKNYFVLVDCHI